MPKWLRALIAGYGAKKLGGGCLSTILIFIVIYWALGQCNRQATPAQPRVGINGQHIKNTGQQKPLAINTAVFKR